MTLGHLIPNPGSAEAWYLGCVCPSRDNARGQGYHGGNGKGWADGGVFVVTCNCPLHDPPMIQGNDPGDEDGGLP